MSDSPAFLTLSALSAAIAARQLSPVDVVDDCLARIDRLEARRSVLGLLPNLNIDLSSNYDSNRYLVHNSWASLGLNVAFNMAKAFSLPALNRSVDAQTKLDRTRALAVAMAVMTQTRIAAVRYELLAQEYAIWDMAVRDDEQIVGETGGQRPFDAPFDVADRVEVLAEPRAIARAEFALELGHPIAQRVENAALALHARQPHALVGAAAVAEHTRRAALIARYADTPPRSRRRTTAPQTETRQRVRVKPSRRQRKRPRLGRSRSQRGV